MTFSGNSLQWLSLKRAPSPHLPSIGCTFHMNRYHLPVFIITNTSLSLAAIGWSDRLSVEHWWQGRLLRSFNVPVYWWSWEDVHRLGMQLANCEDSCEAEHQDDTGVEDASLRIECLSCRKDSHGCLTTSMLKILFQCTGRNRGKKKGAVGRHKSPLLAMPLAAFPLSLIVFVYASVSLHQLMLCDSPRKDNANCLLFARWPLLMLTKGSLVICCRLDTTAHLTKVLSFPLYLPLDIWISRPKWKVTLTTFV